MTIAADKYSLAPCIRHSYYNNMKKITIGCLGLLLLGFIGVIGFMLVWGPMMGSMIKSDVHEYIFNIQAIYSDSEKKEAIVSDLQLIYESLDTKNNFNFMEWPSVDESFESMLEDREIDDFEFNLMVEYINWMKEIQGLKE